MQVRILRLLGKALTIIWLAIAIVFPGKTLWQKIHNSDGQSGYVGPLEIYLGNVSPASDVMGLDETDAGAAVKLDDVVAELENKLRKAGYTLPPVPGGSKNRLADRLYDATAAGMIDPISGFLALWDVGTPLALDKASRLAMWVDLQEDLGSMDAAQLPRRPAGIWSQRAARMLEMKYPRWRRSGALLVSAVQTIDPAILDRALRDSDPTIRLTVATRRFDDASVSPDEVIHLLQSGDPDTVNFVFDHIGDDVPPKVQQYLARRLEGPCDSVTDSVITTLQRAGDRTVLPRVRQLARSAPTYVVSAAYHYLGDLGGARDLPLLINAMAGDPANIGTAVEAASQLTVRLLRERHPLPTADLKVVTNRVIALTEDPSPTVRFRAVHACSELALANVPEAAVRLNELARHGVEDTRLYAQRCMTRTKRTALQSDFSPTPPADPSPAAAGR